MPLPESSALLSSLQLDDTRFLSSAPSDSPTSRFSWSARAALAARSNPSVCTAYGHLAQVATVAWLNTGPRSWTRAPGIEPGEAADVAQALLGLNAAEREAMFDPDPTPGEKFEPTAAVALAMLERAIAEDLVRWRDKPNGGGNDADTRGGWRLPVLAGTAGDKHV